MAGQCTQTPQNCSSLESRDGSASHVPLRPGTVPGTDTSKIASRDFGGGPVVKDQSCNAGDAGSIPGQGIKIPHAKGHLSLQAATREAHVPKLERPVCCNKDKKISAQPR